MNNDSFLAEMFERKKIVEDVDKRNCARNWKIIVFVFYEM